MSKLYVTSLANLDAARAAAAGMFTAPASADGTEPATHYVAYGVTTAEVEAAIAPHSTAYEGSVSASLAAARLALIPPSEMP